MIPVPPMRAASSPGSGTRRGRRRSAPACRKQGPPVYSALHAAKEPRILIGSGSVALPAAAAAKAPAAVVGYSVRAASVSAAASLGP